MVLMVLTESKNSSRTPGYIALCCWLQITPPVFSVYPVEEADRVFQQLSQSRINGRAVFRVSTSDSDAELFPADTGTATSPSTNHEPSSDEPTFYLPHSTT